MPYDSRIGRSVVKRLLVLALVVILPLVACGPAGGGGDAPLKTATWGESRFDEARWAE